MVTTKQASNNRPQVQGKCNETDFNILWLSINFSCFWETIVTLAKQVFQDRETFYCGKMRQNHILVHLWLKPFFGQKHRRDVTCYAGYRDNDNTITSCDGEKRKLRIKLISSQNVGTQCFTLLTTAIIIESSVP